jgi:hypothetical protein
MGIEQNNTDWHRQETEEHRFTATHGSQFTIIEESF